MMRTTVDINPDLLERVRQRADADGVSFKEALNRLLTRGLEAAVAAQPAGLNLPTFNVGFERYFDIRKTNQILAEMDDARILRSMGLLEKSDEDS